MHEVKKSKVEIELALVRLLSLLIASITASLFCTTQKVLKAVRNPTLIIICLYLSKNKQTKRDTIVLIKSFIHDLRKRYYEPSLNWVFVHLRHPVHIIQSIIFNRDVGKIPNLVIRSLMFLLIITFTDKLLILL